jgi:hypothetical protein
VYRHSGNNILNHYPTPDVASSWNNKWSENIKTSDCNGMTLGIDAAKLNNGWAYKCGANDLGEGSGAVYRYLGEKQMNYYSSPDIANSWDANWGKASSIDCGGLSRGANMKLRQT